MSRQIQLRRGTSTEHEAFTGAIGEVTVDTTSNTLRVHDGATPGGTALARADSVTDMTGTDYVVAWQSPTADNNYTWYRKYRSGWCEQGGRSASGTGDKTIQLPVEMQDTYYTICVSDLSGSAGGVIAYGAGSETTTSFMIYASNSSNSGAVYWCIYGFCK